MSQALVRLCEHRSTTVEWPPATRAAMAAAVALWQQLNRVSEAPLWFSGSDGRTLNVAQFVGTLHAGGVTVEVYPKLDTALVEGGEVDAQRAATVMHHLSWLLECSGFAELIDAGDAPMEPGINSFTDLLAWLFARRLGAQLALGLPQEYVGQSDDLPLVRGRIQFARQATTHFGRPDVIACQWDEFSPDTALARVLRCAAEMLRRRSRLPVAVRELGDCVARLDDARAVAAGTALAEAATIRWSRLNLRWRRCHDLALSVLRGLGQHHHSGAGDSFVYLLDMNRVFESFCLHWLQARRWDAERVKVREQDLIGHLLQQSPGGIEQHPDFWWHTREHVWVADAKYKLTGTGAWPRIDDVRQLICYGQLAKQRKPGLPSQLLILHPTTGVECSEKVVTFDNQPLTLQGVRVIR